MTPQEISDLRKKLREDNEQFPERMTQLPFSYVDGMEDNPETLRGLWRSKSYLAQVHEDKDGLIRINVCRSDLDKETGRPLNDIPFKVLQQIKNDMGYGDDDATILLPRNKDWADFGGYTTIYIHPFPLDYGMRAMEVEEQTNGTIIIP